MLQNIPLVSWGNGAFIMIAVFSAVCISLVLIVLLLIMRGSKKNKKIN